MNLKQYKDAVRNSGTQNKQRIFIWFGILIIVLATLSKVFA